MSIEPGVLYVVATPIGNLGDVTQRALEVLAAVDLILVEDTRHTGRLLKHFGIDTAMFALHEHNERRVVQGLLERLGKGEAIALVSDAGTPLISDPGYHLVREALAQARKVVPVPGASAVLCALSVCGLPTDRFVFEGFLPAKSAARRRRLEALSQEPRTMVFYESPHRVLDALSDMILAFGASRPAVAARELTKIYEAVHTGGLEALRAAIGKEIKGEFVLVVGGFAKTQDDDLSSDDRRTLQILLEDLPPAQAAALAARITGQKRKRLYQLAMELGGRGNDQAPDL